MKVTLMLFMGVFLMYPCCHGMMLAPIKQGDYNQIEELSKEKKIIIAENTYLQGFFHHVDYTIQDNCDDEEITCCAFSSNMQMIAFGTNKGGVICLGLETGVKICSYSPCLCSSDILSINSPMPVKNIYFTYRDAAIISTDIAHNSFLYLIESKSYQQHFIPLSPFQKKDFTYQVLSMSEARGACVNDDMIFVYDVDSGLCVAQLPGYDGYSLGSLLFAGDEYLIVAPGPCLASLVKNPRSTFVDPQKNTIFVYDIATKQLISSLHCNSNKPLSLHLSHDQCYLATFFTECSQLQDDTREASVLLKNSKTKAVLRVWRSFLSLSAEQLSALDKFSKISVPFRDSLLTPEEYSILETVPIKAKQMFLENYQAQSPCAFTMRFCPIL